MANTRSSEHDAIPVIAEVLSMATLGCISIAYTGKLYWNLSSTDGKACSTHLHHQEKLISSSSRKLSVRRNPR